jgi:hypothetical protein
MWQEGFVAMSLALGVQVEDELAEPRELFDGTAKVRALALTRELAKIVMDLRALAFTRLEER